MKKAYSTPKVHKVMFDYEQVVAQSSSCKMITIWLEEALVDDDCMKYRQNTLMQRYSADPCRELQIT